MATCIMSVKSSHSIEAGALVTRINGYEETLRSGFALCHPFGKVFSPTETLGHNKLAV